MSDPRTPGVRLLSALGAALLLALGPAGATTQETADELRARLEALKPEWEAARAASLARRTRDDEARRQAAASVATLDTLQVGLVRVVTPVDQSGTARELFEEVWADNFSSIRSSPSLSSSTFAFQWSETHVPIFIDGLRRDVTLDRNWTVRRSTAKDAIRGALAATINFDLRAGSVRMSQWLRGNPLAPPSDEDAYRLMATARSQVVRGCLEGTTSACIEALGLTLRLPPRPVGLATAEYEAARDEWSRESRERLLVWYSPTELRALVADRGRRPPGRAGSGTWGACVEGGDLEACTTYLDEFGGFDREPLRPRVRESFVAFALERADEGAWGRLLQRPELEPAEAIEHATGQPLDELVAEWRRTVMDAQPRTYDGLGSRAGFSMLWLALFSILALRSTRWRMG